MAQLTDEEKAKKVFTGVDDQKSDETDKEDTSTSTEETQEVDGQTEDEGTEASAEGESESETETTETLTKPFPWLKGETPDEWAKELAAAYENSTNEALRLKKQLDDGSITVEEAKKIIATGKQESTATTQGAPALDLDSHPAIQYMKSLEQREMVSAFDAFAKEYPQAREPDDFARFEKAASGASQAFTSVNGRAPTYPELFDATASLLKWQPAKDGARRDAAIKESASSQSSTSSTNPIKKTKLTEAQIAVAKRLFPNQSDEEIVKGLAQYVN